MSRYNKILWTSEMIEFIQDWWPAMSNQELAEILGMHISSVRKKAYELKLFRMKLDFWTPEQVQFLIDNYKTKGDIELAEIFQKTFKKNKPWTFKHIEKKRKYLRLKRTERQLFNIKLRNIDQGRMAGLNWEKTFMRRKIRIGSCVTRTLNGYKVRLIRVKGGFRKLAHVNYENRFGPIPSGKMIIMKDGNPLNCEPDNLLAVTRQEHAERMRDMDAAIAAILSLKGKKGKSGSYKDDNLFREYMKRPDLLQVKRNQLKLQRIISKHENTSRI